MWALCLSAVLLHIISCLIHGCCRNRPAHEPLWDPPSLHPYSNIIMWILAEACYFLTPPISWTAVGPVQRPSISSKRSVPSAELFLWPAATLLHPPPSSSILLHPPSPASARPSAHLSGWVHHIICLWWAVILLSQSQLITTAWAFVYQRSAEWFIAEAFLLWTVKQDESTIRYDFTVKQRIWSRKSLQML